MVIYEVNLSINNDIFQEYYEWLLPHIQQMLLFNGFIKSEIGMVENNEDDNQNHLRVSYTVDSYDNLQHYFDHHASEMRAEAINRFGDKINVTRRIILEPLTLCA
ncbi:hypothetical protein AQUSIP_09900 [Aquicella siphonis]|uniref:DUF4286 domain-containing protein n=1 Tax=Aquicella siphonis TaxID=254247 RepID=A0A5E4PFD7_9COXI|nr:DUF4286 family protein [Aquicella siphonis]VVC75700.1 hypothetical protein AQUSIP_09900 [Aquicella siphonis]